MVKKKKNWDFKDTDPAGWEKIHAWINVGGSEQCPQLQNWLSCEPSNKRIPLALWALQPTCTTHTHSSKTSKVHTALLTVGVKAADRTWRQGWTVGMLRVHEGVGRWRQTMGWRDLRKTQQLFVFKAVTVEKECLRCKTSFHSKTGFVYSSAHYMVVLIFLLALIHILDV